MLGPGTAASAPEIIHALGNGASEVVISAVNGGSAGSRALLNAESNPAVILRARSNGTWSQEVAVDVRSVTNSDGDPVRVSLRIFRSGQVVEEFPDLVVEAGSHQDLFDTINTRSIYVVALDPSLGGATPAPGSYVLPTDGSGVVVPVENATDELFTLFPEPGVDPTGVTVQIESPAGDNVRVRVFRDGAQQEEFSRLTMNPDSANYLPAVLLRDSATVHVRQASSLAGADRLPAAITPTSLAGGVSPSANDYQAAIDRLGDDSRINLVLASVEPTRTDALTRTVHQSLVAHAVAQADAGSPRIAFGSVTPPEQRDLDRIRDHAAAVRNRRFVLVSPAGAAGAVCGAIARTNPEVSPTFKTVPLFGIAAAAYSESELYRLLGPTHNLVVVQQRTGRGVIVLRGLDTSGDQISVTRVADACVREVKAISENFIGELNSADARTALREQIVATFTRMERGGQLVPSTDGSDPAFLVDVYSTQLDFAQGIVRIDIAVRPVRAIDFIYATIRVKN
ncbi:phage tail sheath C-terminal domain-containing protein [Humibacillus xanthopallidus]|uniref:phage tail sheath C-terminal domain-containing protein n=1 Tax=Humibacillus xanthopallidus TaxID=412689 RepID=UPI001639A7DF|nr:phage tail sheath C-terminal domain-containing protein [Humibacillus xanthopallidus]